MTHDLKEKVFVVAGSASGMGLATARTLLARGAQLGLCDLNASGLEALVEELDEAQKSRVLAQPVNVTDRAAVSSFLEKTKSHFGRIDGIANIAGTGGHKLGVENVWETSDQEFDFIMNLNVRGIFNILGEALKPGVLTEPGGSVVHITSMYSVRGYNKGAVFSASKHAADGMVRSAALEVGQRGIRVNVVMPGGVDTPMYRAVRGSAAGNPTPNNPIPRPGKPEEIANVVAFLLSEESSYVTGALWNVDGGANA